MKGLNNAIWDESLAAVAQHLRNIDASQLNHVGGVSKTPLMWACSRRRIDVIQLLLDAKADVCIQYSGYDALCYALAAASFDLDHEVVQLLFARGATCAGLHNWANGPVRSIDLARCYARLAARIRSAALRAATILSARFRAHTKLPRDMAMLLAREIWRTRHK